MSTRHPSWCVGTEPAESDHVSQTLSAAEPGDSIDIRARLTQPELETSDETRWTMLELEFVDYGQMFAFPLDLHQARALADALARLLPPQRQRSAPVLAGGSARPRNDSFATDPSDLGA